MSAGATCRLHRWRFCSGGRLSRCGVCASGQLASLWRAFPVACGQLCLVSPLARLWGFPVALSSASLNAHADGWRCPAWCRLLASVAGCQFWGWCRVLRLLAWCRLVLPVASIGGGSVEVAGLYIPLGVYINPSGLTKWQIPWQKCILQLSRII